MELNGHEIVYFGHSAFLIRSKGGVNILIDPWISNPSNTKKLEDFVEKVHYILLTHAHGDHLGDAIELGKKYNPEIIAIYEITNFLAEKGLKNVTGMNMGGTVKRDGVAFTMVEATHSSTITDAGKTLPGGNPCGFIVTLEDGLKVYHMGDTGLIGSIELIGKLYRPQVVLVPIGGHFTIGPEEAGLLMEILKPEVIIPMHYKTFPLIDVKVEEFIEKLSPDLRTRVKPLKPGEVLR